MYDRNGATTGSVSKKNDPNSLQTNPPAEATDQRQPFLLCVRRPCRFARRAVSRAVPFRRTKMLIATAVPSLCVAIRFILCRLKHELTD